MNASGKSQTMMILTYAIPLGTILVFAVLLASGRQLTMPVWLVNRGGAALARIEALLRRVAPAGRTGAGGRA
jgi:hypothetical protein